MNKAELMTAVNAALDGDWDAAHKIAQNHSDNSANWLHAVLHKIEGDKWNSQYWYARTAGRAYGDFAEVMQELIAIKDSLK
ncbi:MAG: hypothetical protein WC009_07605 [Methylotenera sp.]